MARVERGSEEHQRICEALERWRQGDCAVDEQYFVHVADGARPLTPEAEGLDEELQAVTSDDAVGLVLLTQTCDIVRDCIDRPFVEVAPLIEVSPDQLREVARGRRPNFALVPGLEDRLLVADLERVMTVEKSIVASWARTEGCRTDEEVRAFARSLARKRVRPAFPNDFVDLVGPLQTRIIEKHDRASDEGRSLRALREIRVHAAPSWESDEVDLFFWFIRQDDVPDDQQPTHEDLAKWLQRVPARGRFRTVGGQIASLDDMTARDYVDSDPLDLDHLSRASSRAAPAVEVPNSGASD